MTSKAYKKRIAASKAEIDFWLHNDAKRFGHRGPDELVLIIRERHNISIDRDYAKTLCVMYHKGKNA
jgi:hypothetical protein